jgi:mono/diheme cytochrome c family protein
VTSRFRLARIVGPLCVPLVLALSGCSDAWYAGPMSYVESERLAADLKEKPELQKAVRKAMADLFGPDPQHIKVPEGAGLPLGGLRLAKYWDRGNGDFKKVQRTALKHVVGDQQIVDLTAGGYALYRQHCLHCHGVSGAGDGPTAPFVYPRPRDYRRGLFKFTSTPNGAKPTRDDLRKTIRYGLHGTSMPAFEALMTESEIEQVVDYMTFLSMRGETELALIDEAASAGELPAEVPAEVAKSVFNRWKQAESQVVNPPVPRTPTSAESVARGRELFLGVGRGLTKQGAKKVDCTSCHGPEGVGNGPSFVSQDVFNEVVFGGDPSEQAARLDQVVKRAEEETRHRTGDAKLAEAEAGKIREAWKNSLDDWGMPLRPANLNRGVYKGGRRPIDLYWRIAKGINGAKMPAHYPAIEPAEIWDLVNFVLALPYEPTLLEGAQPSDAPAAASAPKVAGR